MDAAREFVAHVENVSEERLLLAAQALKTTFASLDAAQKQQAVQEANLIMAAEEESVARCVCVCVCVCICVCVCVCVCVCARANERSCRTLKRADANFLCICVFECVWYHH